MTVPAVPTTASPSVPFGQALGEAYRNAHALHLRLLAREGSSFLDWVVLNITAASSAPVGADELCERLSKELAIDASEVDGVVSALRSSGRLDAVTVNGRTCLELSGDGRTYHRRLRAAVNQGTAELLGTFEPAEIATAVQVLLAVRERAPSIAAH